MDFPSPNTPPPGENNAAIPDSDWKRTLKARLGTWIDSLAEPPSELLSENPPQDPASEPELPQIWEAIIALEAHTRTQARKTVKALEDFSGELNALRTQKTEKDAAPDLLASIHGIAEINAQLSRMNAILETPPKPAPLGLSRNWEAAWESLAQGGGILQRSLKAVLEKQGLRIEAPAPGTAFDPASMEAVEVLSGSETTSAESVGVVYETLEPAYFHESRLLRPARVRVVRGSL